MILTPSTLRPLAATLIAGHFFVASGMAQAPENGFTDSEYSQAACKRIEDRLEHIFAECKKLGGPHAFKAIQIFYEAMALDALQDMRKKLVCDEVDRACSAQQKDLTKKWLEGIKDLEDKILKFNKDAEAYVPKCGGYPSYSTDELPGSVRTSLGGAGNILGMESADSKGWVEGDRQRLLKPLGECRKAQAQREQKKVSASGGGGSPGVEQVGPRSDRGSAPGDGGILGCPTTQKRAYAPNAVVVPKPLDSKCGGPCLPLTSWGLPSNATCLSRTGGPLTPTTTISGGSKAPTGGATGPKTPASSQGSGGCMSVTNPLAKGVVGDQCVH